MYIGKKAMLTRQVLFGVAALWLVTAASAETFQPESLMGKYEINETSCKSNPNSVWAVVDNKGDCIRYYAAGFSNGPNEAAIIYIHGDRLWGEKPIGYDDNDSDKQQQNVEAIHKSLGLPFVMIARPGTYGSSGSHAHRREMRELQLVDTAIKVIRDRYKIERTALTGQSGGGTVAAYVLTKQSDLNCVVLTSSALSMATVLNADAKSIYDTSHPDLYNPIEHVMEVRANSARTVFVIGMDGDKFSPFANQREYADALRAMGHNVQLLEGQATGSFGHTLDRTGRTVGAWCLSGMPLNEIAKRVHDRQVTG